MHQTNPRGKWTPVYEGPLMIKKIFYGSATTLTTMDSENSLRLVKEDIVKNTMHEKETR